MKKLINPKFNHLSEWVDSFLEDGYFELHGELLYDVGRNVVKRFQQGGVDVVVKRFRQITAFNRFIYATFRESKAIRAYRYASHLRAMGIFTPEEIAVLETYVHGMLADSYFISLYSPANSLSFLQEFTFEKKEWFPLLDNLANWIFGIHDKGIIHQDLNVSNILYQDKKNGDGAFQLIDNNRMKFRRNLSVEERLKDICRLSTNLELHLYVLKKYVELMPYDGQRIKMKGCFYKLMFECRQMAKRKMKRMIAS